jgi:hypothetical protein
MDGEMTDADEDVKYFRKNLWRSVGLVRDREGLTFKLRDQERVVRVLQLTDYDSAGTGIWWEVEDILSGEKLTCGEGSLGKELNEMEVLAWAARTSSSTGD